MRCSLLHPEISLIEFRYLMSRLGLEKANEIMEECYSASMYYRVQEKGLVQPILWILIEDLHIIHGLHTWCTNLISWVMNNFDVKKHFLQIILLYSTDEIVWRLLHIPKFQRRKPAGPRYRQDRQTDKLRMSSWGIFVGSRDQNIFFQQYISYN